MDANLKSLVRRELVLDLIKADMDQEQLESYLKTDLEKLPSEWVKDQGGVNSKKAMDEFLDEKFPETEEKEEAE